MLKKLEVNINNRNFEIEQFPAREALRIQFILMEKFGSVLLSGNKSILDLDIAALFSKLDEEEFINIVLRILSKTKIKGIPVNINTFDTLFESDLSEVFLSIKEVLLLNYQDFFLKLTSSLNIVQKQTDIQEDLQKK